MKRKLIISLCAVLISSVGMAQEESGKKGLFHHVTCQCHDGAWRGHQLHQDAQAVLASQP